jgi:hypothetical protein
MNECGLARLTRALQIHHRRIAQGRQEARREIPPFHGGYSTRWWVIFHHSLYGRHAGSLAEAVPPGNVALRVQLRQELTGKKLPWDAPALHVANSEEANKFLRREYWEGWTI